MGFSPLLIVADCVLERCDLRPELTMVYDCDGSRPTVCVTGRWAGVDSAWEQEKLEARKMLKNGDESHLSSARFVGRAWGYQNATHR